MKIISFKSVDSTQKYLKESIASNKLETPVAIVADEQTNGVGSRNNSWIGLSGNLFFSFAINISELPKDLKLESSSIYFSYLLKETLSEFNSALWLKWPNDFYLENSKIGGAITNIVHDKIVCGIGINLVASPNGYSALDIDISKEDMLNAFFEKLEKKILWKQVFSKYELEFRKSQKFYTHAKELRISLTDAVLQNDGSILVNGERIYSLR